MKDSLSNPSQARLLFLEVLPTISGGQAVLLKLVPALSPSYTLHALVPGGGPLARELQRLGVTCHLVPMGNYTLVRKTLSDIFMYALRLPRLVLITRQIIQQQQIDLVYANSARAFVWGTVAAALAGKPILWHHHNLLADGITLTILRWMGHWITVRRIIAVSRVAATQFDALKNKVTVVPTGVDTHIFRPDQVARARIRTELNIPADTLTAGIIGDLIPLKGQHTLIEAAKLGPAQVRYLVIGSPRLDDQESIVYAAHLREIAQPSIIFAGYRSDLPAVLNCLDILVIASERETGPLVMLEALACGVPVISTPVGRAAELLPPEALFPVGRAPDLAERVQFWLADSGRLQAARSAARACAEKQFDLEQCNSRIRAEIERVVQAT